MIPRQLQLWLPPLAVLLLVLGGWQLAVVWLGVPAIVLPSPWRIVLSAVDGWQPLLQATLITSTAATLGLASSLVLGTATAMVFSQSRLLRRSLFPYAIFLQTVPIVAIAPVIVIWMGEGLAAVIVIATIVSLFPLITNTTEGLISVPAGLQDLFRLHHASRWQTLWKLQVPACLPFLVAGLKISSGAAVLGAIVGEIFAGAGSRNPGLGFLIFAAKGQFKLDFLFAAVLACTLLGVVFFGTVSWIGERWLLYWTDPKIHESPANRP